MPAKQRHRRRQQTWQHLAAGQRNSAAKVHLSTRVATKWTSRWSASVWRKATRSLKSDGRLRRRRPGHRRLDQHGLRSGNEARKTAFKDWCVDAEMMQAAKPDALFHACPPAPRGRGRSRGDRRPAISRGTKLETVRMRRRRSWSNLAGLPDSSSPGRGQPSGPQTASPLP
jgi:ornithine carbamoyltransferase